MATVDVRLFGRPSISIDGVDARLTARLLQLTVRLAAASPSGVATDRLVAELWPRADGSDGALRVAVNRLRAVVGARHLRFEHGAYRLVDVDVDLHRFERLARSARDLDGDDRADTLERALRLADAPAFDGLRDLPWIQPMAQRIDELHESVVDSWIDALLAGGRSDGHLPELITALDRAPTRERRCEMVALALYRAGRQADALRAITRTRRSLRDELGVHPGSALAQLEHRILAHDPTLSADERADAGLDVEARLRAAEALVQAGAHRDAAGVLDGAEAAAGRTGRHAGLVALARARLATATGEQSPRPHIERAQRIGRESRDGPLLARAALAFVGLGVPDDKTAALVNLTEPLALLPPDAPERVDLLCAAAVFVTFIDASDTMHQLLAEAERVDACRRDLRSRLVLLVARSLVASLDPASLDRAGADAEAALDIARRLGEPDLTVVAIQAALRAWCRNGDLLAVEGVVDELDEASRLGSIPFGRVRAHLCRASVATARGDLDAAERHVHQARRLGVQLATAGTEAATRTIGALIGVERDQRDELRRLAAEAEAVHGPSAWSALAAWAGDEARAADLATIGANLPRDDAFDVFTALSADVAARRGDAALGRWCRRHLEPLAGRTVLVGLGTVVLGFADHYVGLALAASGDLPAAVRNLERARRLAAGVGAACWEASSTVELAAVLADLGDVAGAERALRELSRPTRRIRRRAAEVAADLPSATALG